MTSETSDATITNPLLPSLRIPGETFRMPSQGLFYENNEVDSSVVNGEVEVYPMTAMEEVILSTPDKLLSGKAVTEIFAHCIPQVKSPGALLSRDVDFLMACLRLVTFGPKMVIAFKHNCENAKEHAYTVDVQRMIATTRSIDATRMKEEYTYTLPNNQVARMKPLTYDEVVKLFQNTAMIKNEGLTEAEAKMLIVDTLASVVVQVDSVTDKQFIREWVAEMSWDWKRKLQTAVQSVSQWGTEFISTHTCEDCGEEIKIQISSNPVQLFM